jgi:hypothetical protein
LDFSLFAVNPQGKDRGEREIPGVSPQRARFFMLSFVANPVRRFALKTQIEEIHDKINELGG